MTQEILSRNKRKLIEFDKSNRIVKKKKETKKKIREQKKEIKEEKENLPTQQ